MRIDNRKVNGSIKIDNTDLVAVFNIMIDGETPSWVFWNPATNGPEKIDPGIVVHDLNRVFQRSKTTMLRFNIVLSAGNDYVYFSPTFYAINGKKEIKINIAFDIADGMYNRTITISLTTGDITLE